MDHWSSVPASRGLGSDMRIPLAGTALTDDSASDAFKIDVVA
jgi:hypothetical protein